MDDVVEEVKDVIKERARIVRSNLCRPNTNKPRKSRSSVDPTVILEAVEDVVVETTEVVENKRRTKKSAEKSKKKIRVDDEETV